MAKKRDNELFDSLRKSGMRKKVAKATSESAAATKNGKPPKAVTQTVEKLKQAASDLERQATGSSHREAGSGSAHPQAQRSEAQQGCTEGGAHACGSARS